MVWRALGRINRAQKGITGLETAIILIAFVVVASVFAYTALSAGLFSTQKSQEAVYSGLEETRSTLELKGDVVAYKGDSNISSSVGKVEFTVSNALEGEAIDLTPPYTYDGTDLSSSGLDHVVQISYNDESVFVPDCAWTLSWVGKHSDDYLLEDDEKAVITVWFHNYASGAYSPTDESTTHFLGNGNWVQTNHTFTLEVKPPKGAVLNIERTTPAYLDTVMDLH